MFVKWSRSFSLSDHRDCALGTCISGNKLYVLGMDEYKGLGRMRYRILTVNTDDGSKIAEWADDASYPYAVLTSCASVDEDLYVVGVTNKFWSILAFDRYMKLLDRKDYGEPRVMPLSVTTTDKDRDHLYLGGIELSPDKSTSMYIAMVSKKGLEIVSSNSIRLDDASTGCYAVGYNHVADRIIAGGYVKTDKGLEWLVVFLDRELKPVKVITPGINGSITSIAIDHEGYVYAVDGKNVAKIDTAGRVIAKAEIPSAVRIGCSRNKDSRLSQYVVVVAENEAIALSKTTLGESRRSEFMKDTTLYLPCPSSLAIKDDEIYIVSTAAESQRKYFWLVSKLVYG